MLYFFNAQDEPETHDVQYFEMFCNRGIYYKGWSAVTRHSTPWTMNLKLPAFDDAQEKMAPPAQPPAKA